MVEGLLARMRRISAAYQGPKSVCTCGDLGDGEGTSASGAVSALVKLWDSRITLAAWLEDVATRTSLHGDDYAMLSSAVAEHVPAAVGAA